MDDYISRQEAINAINALHEKPNAWLDSAVEAVMMLPSAQPEPKSGTWIYDGVKRICPFCKDFIVTGRSIVKYCWNCGARLKERSEE